MSYVSYVQVEIFKMKNNYRINWEMVGFAIDRVDYDSTFNTWRSWLSYLHIVMVVF